jgi:peptidoglycan/xylan/chitin deacetylase (PgdA/CDA1 family)
MTPNPHWGPLPHHQRFAYSAVSQRADFTWPQGKRLAVYLGFNIEHFAFGSGLGANIGPVSPQPDVLNYMWREYGNRVGVWRCLDLFDDLCLPTGAIINTALYDHCPEVVAACVRRGDELIGHGHSNAERQADLPLAQEAELLRHCSDRMHSESGVRPAGWLSPWISESLATPDLLAQAGYAYTLNWCHDDQPVKVNTQSGQALWSIPYPQELNDIPMIMARQMDASAFAQMIIDQFDEMLRQTSHPTRAQSLVMGIALHPYIMGQPYRLLHLRRALQHIVAHRERIWITTPGAICQAAQSTCV